MICETCTSIPLDLFLPKDAKASRFKNGKAWHGAWMMYEGPDALDRLAKSSADGCVLCSIVSGVLDRAEPLWALRQFTGKGHNMLLSAPRAPSEFPEGVSLKCTQEGEMVISDGRRTGGVYWELEGLGYGVRRSIVNEKADCEKNFAIAQQWIDTCAKEHSSCRRGQDKPSLPTRLVHLNADEDGQIHPRLVMPSNQGLDPETTRYFALSHCWGTNQGKQIPKTTKENLSSHLERLDLASLPKTFTDAMEMTRRVGVEYIWIDSLCIIQDDKNDFSSECSRMHLIYSKAYCTIAASDSPDGDGGCFLPRDVEKIQPCKVKLINLNIPYQRDGIMDIIWGRFPNDPHDAEVTIYPNFGPWIKSLQGGAIFSRGWCLQERELSPELLWECRECTAAEDEPEFESKSTNANLAPHLSRFRVLDENTMYTYSTTRSGIQWQVHKWDMIAEAFSEKKLTVSTDKLPAVSGIAAVIAQWHDANDVYLAGIWKSNLLRGLSWFPRKIAGQSPVGAESWPAKAVDEDIPSWSWAAHDGPIAFRGETWFSGSWSTVIDPDGNEKWIKSGVEVEIQSASTNLATTDNFGRVSGGEITLLGWTAEVNISEQDLVVPEVEGSTGPGKKVPFVSKCYSAEKSIPGLTVYFDQDVDSLKEVRLLCFQLGTGKSVSGKEQKADVGLVLLESPGREDVYVRLGIFDVAGDRKSAWHASREKKSVTMI
ncbi:hypothetical protein PT974_02224 [Cladobotryum mycophilum]|uniref:Heterokaryon incompatibility domain-containing protein n=1 Tax=Cladobotryum mycophilum TaxID=491253 RepID=A0ABR0SXN9_9HYPO